MKIFLSTFLKAFCVIDTSSIKPYMKINYFLILLFSIIFVEALSFSILDLFTKLSVSLLSWIILPILIKFEILSKLKETCISKIVYNVR